MKPLLSVLIPTIRERCDKATALIDKIKSQAKGKPVEILWLGDNFTKSVGEKRNNLVSIASGEFCAFVDDDDDVAEDYISKLIPVIAAHSKDIDVVSFQQHAVWNDLESTVEFSVKHHPFGQFTPAGITCRFPWHVCAWKTAIARQAIFEHVNVGEDAAWVGQVVQLTKREAHIPHVLHYYRHQDNDSAAYRDKPPTV